MPPHLSTWHQMRRRFQWNCAISCRVINRRLRESILTGTPFFFPLQFGSFGESTRRRVNWKRKQLQCLQEKQSESTVMILAGDVGLILTCTEPHSDTCYMHGGPCRHMLHARSTIQTHASECSSTAVVVASGSNECLLRDIRFVLRFQQMYCARVTAGNGVSSKPSRR